MGKKLSEEQIKEVCRLYECGISAITISGIIGVSSSCIRTYLREKEFDTSYRLIPINPGDKFGRWTVIEEFPRKNKRRYFLCECSCPDKMRKEVCMGGLRGGRSKSCGCHKKEKQSDRRLNSGIDYTGYVFGRLTVLYEVERDNSKARQAIAQCSCPDKTIKKYQIGNLRSGTTSSCGCLLSKRVKERETFQVKDYKEIHPLFYKVEEIQDCKDGIGIEVQCKNSNCRNWFTPTSFQIQRRIRAIERPEKHLLGTENNFYFSDNCKHSCILFNLKSDPYDIAAPWTPYELSIFSKEVKHRQFLEYSYNFCELGDCEDNKEGPFHAHHVIPK